jgi:phosphoribosyl 1,2-cyclic phosphodiesterase
MIAISLQSGSNGNCIYVEAEGVRLLFDAGISGIQAEQRLAALGRDIRRVDALIISHDHADHLRCAGIYQRKYGIPLHITPRTLAAGKMLKLGRLSEVRPFQAGEGISFGNVSVRTVPTPHDGADGVAFVVETRKRRLGILTDLGHLFQGLDTVIASLDAIFLESNFDPEMLAQGPYPEFLKQRIRGPGGHLSNEEAAGVLKGSATGRTQWVCLAHLSEHNNHPELARWTHQRVLGQRFPIHIAGRYEATGILLVQE